MDLTNVIGAIFNSGKSTQQKAGGIDIAEIIKLVMAAKQGSASNSSNGIDISSILKQLGGKDNGALASVILQQVLAGKLGQKPSSNGSFGNMNTTDIAGAAKSAADILKGILGSK